MGGGGGGTSNSTTNQYNNQTYNYTGGNISLDNLLGNFNYKSSGGSFGGFSNTGATFNTTSKNTNTAENTNKQEGGAGGSSSVGLSYGGGGVGGGGGGGGMSNEASTSQYGGAMTISKSTGIPTPILYAGLGLGGVYLLAKMSKKKRGKK